MKTDSLFYRLFQSFPSLLFELMGVKNGKPESYKFRSVEIKQTAFRLDGVFIPQDNDSSLPLFFVEVQFQPETDFYSRFFAEIFLYLRQYQPIHPWQAVVIYPNRATEVGDTFHYEDLLASKRVHRIYLQELTENEDDESIVIGLVKLIVMSEDKAITVAKTLINKTLNQIKESSRQKLILDLVETIIVYKLPQISRQEFLKMMGLNDISLKDTRFYQDVFAEGRQEEAKVLILRQIKRRFSNISINLELKIKQLELEKIENLAESIFDFNTIEDLEIWLNQQSTVK